MRASVTYPSDWSDLSVALAHDWLTGMRGGERVLELLCNGFPEAHLYTLLHVAGSVSERIASHPIHTSFVQRLPGMEQHYRYALPIFPAAIRSFRPVDADLLISSSHCVAKGLRTSRDTRHLCYCYTPMRYAWLFHNEYFGQKRLKRAALSPVLAALRSWDARTAEGVDHFVAISRHVQSRIQRFYGRNADVVYPPVRTDWYTPAEQPRAEYDLVVSALVPYKRVDLAVEAYNRLGIPLKIAGSGSGLEALRKKAGPNIEFVIRPDDDEVRELYRHCRCLIFPGEEDFGIVPVEAMSCGRPVVAYGRGGALETVPNEVGGVFFDEQSVDALCQAVETCSARKWNPSAIREQAQRFSSQNFIDGLAQSVKRLLA